MANLAELLIIESVLMKGIIIPAKLIKYMTSQNLQNFDVQNKGALKRLDL